MNKTWTGLVVAMLATCGGAAQAASYYVSDCQSGAAAGCVAGNDTNNGTSPTTPWRSTQKVQSVFSSLAPGDKVLFARGGAWINAGMTLQNLSSSAASPITLDSYAASWSNSAKPLLQESTQGAVLLAFSDGGSPEQDGGYVVQNLDLRGNGGLFTRGIFANQLTKDITLQNLNIEGFDIGLYCGAATPRINLLNSTLKNNKGQGVLTECHDSAIEGNTFDNNGFGEAVLDHSIYVNDDFGGARNLTIRNNVITNNAVIDGLCRGVALVVHGRADGLLIENNLIYQAPDTSNPGCWGIAVDNAYPAAESFTNIVIRGNTVVNLGGIGIGCGSCIAPLIENNVIIQERGPYLAAISVPDRATGSGDAADTGAIIRNNSIYFARTPAESIGIALFRDGRTAGSNVRVASNLIYFGQDGGQGSADHQCFDLTGVTTANFTVFNNNLCHHVNGVGRYSPSHATLAAGQAAGYDANGMSADPQLNAVPSSANGWSMALNLGSPAINAGHATQSAPNDRYGVARSGVPDIGAHEHQPPACTAGPAWVRIANEYRTFTVPAANVVRFGNTGGWLTQTTSPSSSCTTGTFGGTPPGAGAKWCELQNSSSTATRVAIGHDYQTFTIPTAQTVYYGNASGWTSKAFAAGTFGCGPASFNNVDPAPGAKRCEILVQPATCSP